MVSLLENETIRPLHLALAESMVKAQSGSPRMELLNRLYSKMRPLEQFLCRAALRRNPA
jgi:hypothetical protein